MCNCGSQFPSNALDSVFNLTAPPQKQYNVVLNPSDGIGITSSTQVDSQGNVTYTFNLSVQGVGSWRDVAVGANGQPANRSSTRRLRSRIERWTKPSYNNADLSASGPQAFITLDGSYGLVAVAPPVVGPLPPPTPPLIDGQWYHICTVDAAHIPAKASAVPAVLITNEATFFPTVAEIRSNGQVWAVFNDPNYNENNTYAIEIHANYVTEV